MIFARPMSGVALALIVATSTPHAQACDLPLQSEARIAATIDSRTLQLDDGRDLRLAGLAALPADHAARATAMLATFVGQSVTLHGDSDAPDRYGRQTLLVRRVDATEPLQSELLAQGNALANLTFAPCAKLFRQAEATARRDRRGIWSDAKAIKNAERPDDLLAGIGQFVVVEGRVLSVRASGPVTYVNFGRRWTRDFAVTMPSKVLPSFEAAGLSPNALAGRLVRVRGFLERRGDAPRIEAIQPGQIEIVGTDDVASSGK